MSMRLLLPWAGIQSSNTIRSRSGFNARFPYIMSVYLYEMIPFFQYDLEIWDNERLELQCENIEPRLWAIGWKSAMKKADAMLIARGYTLITKERAKKLELLL